MRGMVFRARQRQTEEGRAARQLLQRRETMCVCDKPGAGGRYGRGPCCQATETQATHGTKYDKPLPSMNAIRERPSQLLHVSHTRGCYDWKAHWAISFDLTSP